MNGTCKTILALCCFTLVAGCIPTQRELRMERDLEEMKRRLAEVERKTGGLAAEGIGGPVDRLAELGRRQAETQAGLDALRVEFQSVNGRMEDLGRANQQIQEDLSLTREDLGLKIAALEERLGRPERSGGAGPAARETEESPQALYEKGLRLVRNQDDLGRAREVFQTFLKRHPNHELAVNAHYWIGETWYGEKKYENAILQFQDVIQKYKGHPKAASALYKQALAFQALGDEKNARVLLQRVGTEYPKSEEAPKAKERLQGMKKN